MIPSGQQKIFQITTSRTEYFKIILCFAIETVPAEDVTVIHDISYAGKIMKFCQVYSWSVNLSVCIER